MKKLEGPWGDGRTKLTHGSDFSVHAVHTYIDHKTKFRALKCLCQNNTVWTYCEDTNPAIYKMYGLTVKIQIQLFTNIDNDGITI